MFAKAFEIKDPALQGYSNTPRLSISVEPDLHDEVWTDLGYIDFSKMAPKYYFGRGDQFNEMSGDALAEMLENIPQAQLAGRHIWVVWELQLETTWHSTGRVPLVHFQLYHAHECLNKTGHGALAHKIDVDRSSPLTLVNGWTSRSSVFNSTGIMQQHFTEVDLVTRRSNTPRTMDQICLPVDFVERAVKRTAKGFYELRSFTEKVTGFKSYAVMRTDKQCITS